jgi:twitching motility protein PilU
MVAIEQLFQLMQAKSASDLFLSVNAAIHLKINGELLPVNQHKMESAQILALLTQVVKPDDLKRLAEENELNIGIPVPGIGRFRLSAFCQRGSISAVFRYIPVQIPDLNTLKLPPILAELVMERHGLILVVGATGSGKSTTIASMLDKRNEARSGHILTLEDPIEYLYRSKKSIVNQREIGSDTDSLQVALKNALRQAPDCILIGEIRDKATMSDAMAYAQSGHLVVATLHANNSYNALNRIISFFPLENRQSLLQDLSSTLCAIVSQRLVRNSGGGRTPAVEVMRNTQYVAQLIEKGDIEEIKNAIERSLSPGSQTFEQALIKLIRDGSITRDEAVSYADSATNLLWQLNNSSDGSAAKAEAKKENGPTFSEFTMNS